MKNINLFTGQKYVELWVNDSISLSCSSKNASNLVVHKSGDEERGCLNNKETDLLLSFKADSQIFITEPETDLKSDGNYLIIPCRTNRMVSDDQVRLHVQRSLLQDVLYDPRKGFIIELDRLQNLKSTKFRCSYRQHISQEFTYAGSARNRRPMILAKEWAVVEDKLTVECLIQVDDDPSQYYFHWYPPEEV
ncbi:unnamed protein product [Gongylonema pulchrum]|uniref:Ig-like domain-containing protein n=1 Tax=Gongylonema pulchrum TaxID=637853 RepID=A0A183CZ23_9BILA|nr:unnamed protein product [Gongylonema pulchrum]